ncbi:PstS family phosphate ABC transporter substrate-binding protein [Vibrio cholerae]
MTFRLRSTVLASVCLALMSTTAHGKDLIKIEGSSTVYPITQAVADHFMRAERHNTQVVVGITGTGGGFRKFCRGRTDISNASRPIKEKERALCEINHIDYIELPVALDAITVVVNKENQWIDALSLNELKTLWESTAERTITHWQQVNPHFPDRPIVLHGPGSDSGTYDYFVEVVLDGKASRQDYTANEDDEALVAEVAADPNAMAFIGFAYYLQNQDKLKAVAISPSGFNAVKPSVENVIMGRYAALSRPLFIYVNKQALEKRPSLKRFVDSYIDRDNINKVVSHSGYIPLSNDRYDAARFILNSSRSGSVSMPK